MFGCQFFPRVSLFFSVIVRDSMASMGALKFVGPNSIRVWRAFHEIVVIFCVRIPFFGIFWTIRNLFELDFLL